MATPRVSAFEVPGADGFLIRGNVHTGAKSAEQRPTVVICHGFKGFKDWGMFPVLADRLARAGFTAVRFNFSGAGVSDGDQFDQPDRFARGTFTGSLTDLDTVIEWLGTPAVGLLGHSRGGGVAVLQAARDARVAALVTWAAIADTARWDAETIARWESNGQLDIVNARTGEVLPMSLEVLNDVREHRTDTLNIERAAGEVRVPWLIVHGSDDEAVPVTEAERLASKAGSVADLRVVAGGGHTFGARHPWVGPTPHTEEVFAATVEWFARHFR